MRRGRVSREVSELLAMLILTTVPCFYWYGQSYALKLSNRSVSISTSIPSATATHSFKITVASPDPIGSIEFQYCSNAALFSLPCNTPAGLNVNNAVLSEQTGNTGFSVDSNDTNSSTLVISRASINAQETPSTYTFNDITNPSGNNTTTYVRISTYSSTDASGASIDTGAMAFSTNTNFEVGAYIPPFLNICVGVTVADDCSQSQGDSLELGILTPQDSSTATSQYAASTNSSSGYGVFLLGNTMTSGNNVIQPLSSTSASHPGTDEFGINLRKNTNPSVGVDPLGDGTAEPYDGYNNPNLFSFVPGSMLSGSTESTDYNLMTVSYLTNVSSSQPPGVYNTTITYLASAQF
jgi:hypothetical protein